MDGFAVVDASGNATITLQNSSTVKGFRIDIIAITVPNETEDGECRIYRGLPTNDSLLAISGLARADQANGPYWVAPGAYLTLVFSGLTPGNTAYANATGYVETGLQQGALHFENPPQADVVPTDVVLGETLSTGVYMSVTNDIPIPKGTAKTFPITPWNSALTKYNTEGSVWRLRNLWLSVDAFPGATNGNHNIGITTNGNSGAVIMIENPATTSVVWTPSGVTSATILRPDETAYTDRDTALLTLIKMIGDLIAIKGQNEPRLRYQNSVSNVAATEQPIGALTCEMLWERMA